MSERDLWAAVLRQAISDASRGDKVLGEAALNRDRARNFLARPSEDLALVCDLADVSMEVLLASVQKLGWYGWHRPARHRVDTRLPDDPTRSHKRRLAPEELAARPRQPSMPKIPAHLEGRLTISLG